MLHLTFHLYGPMASWGDIAVGEHRPTWLVPSKSAILGLLAAALGIRRDDASGLERLHSAYGYAVCAHRLGTPLKDYHTAQVPPARKGRNRRYYRTRQEELADDDLNTVLSSRDYRMDALHTIIVWEAESPVPHTLHGLAEALRQPTFVLYLGRKSCPPALPLHPSVLDAPSLRAAVEMSGMPVLHASLADADGTPARQICWEEHPNPGYNATHQTQRRDRPLSRTHWQFGLRDEYHAVDTPTSEGDHVLQQN